MGLGSFRLRFVAVLVMLLIVWQSVRMWSANDPTLSEEVSNDAENGEPRASVKIQKVLVTVYYEALCPDSRSFVVKQLEPTFQALNENIEIQMIPYGKATTIKTDNGYEFTCQHGLVECEANMIHACAIDVIKDPAVQLEFLTCMIKNNLNPVNITKVCGDRMHIDVKPVLDCQQESRGKDLLAMYGKMTEALRPQVSFIPTIALDKSSDNQPAILKNLIEQVCRRFKVLPKGCT